MGNWGRVKCGIRGRSGGLRVGKMGGGLTVEFGDEWENGEGLRVGKWGGLRMGKRERVKDGKKGMA